MRDWDELRLEVEQQGDLGLFQMSDFLDFYGGQKVGKAVARNVSWALQKHGLGHYPEALHRDGQSWVLVYRLDTPIHSLFQVALTLPRGREWLDQCVGIYHHEMVVDGLRALVQGDAATLLAKLREFASERATP